jgi:N-acetylmuramic acid 6-phosphate etherase
MTCAAKDLSGPIDKMPGQAALLAMLESQVAAARSVQAALPEITLAARALADGLAAGASVTYAAAGSSGLMALSDACELPGTFGIPGAQIRIAMAGGVPANGEMPGDTEDDAAAAEMVAQTLHSGDIALVVSASGTTPYALALARAAQTKGASVIAIANTPGSALLALADIAICLPTRPEVIEGSTRLGAGTAQKIALNMISTMAGVLLGHVHDGLMVNLHPDNIKLRKRAADIVCQITGATRAAAQSALQTAQYDTKLATLLAAGAALHTAQGLLDQHKGHLRPCLDALKTA